MLHDINIKACFIFFLSSKGKWGGVIKLFYCSWLSIYWNSYGFGTKWGWINYTFLDELIFQVGEIADEELHSNVCCQVFCFFSLIWQIHWLSIQQGNPNCCIFQECKKSHCMTYQQALLYNNKAMVKSIGASDANFKSSICDVLKYPGI